MLKKEYEILLHFVKAPWAKLTFRDVKRLSGKKSESYVYNTLKKFVGEGFLKEERFGKSVLYSMNLASTKTQVYAGIIAEHDAWNQKHIPYETIERTAKLVPAPLHVLIVTGSYASRTQRKGSDLDIAIIIDDSEEPKRVYAELRHECEMSVPRIHLYVFRVSEFLAMLAEEKPNYGKETAKNSMVLYGGAAYFNMIGRAVRNGFAG